jgi:hypothetical protein
VLPRALWSGEFGFRRTGLCGRALAPVHLVAPSAVMTRKNWSEPVLPPPESPGVAICHMATGSCLFQIQMARPGPEGLRSQLSALSWSWSWSQGGIGAGPRCPHQNPKQTRLTRHKMATEVLLLGNKKEATEHDAPAHPAPLHQARPIVYCHVWAHAHAPPRCLCQSKCEAAGPRTAGAQSLQTPNEVAPLSRGSSPMTRTGCTGQVHKGIAGQCR